MFRGRRSAVLGLFLMLAACSAEARELGLSIDGRVGGDSNVTRSRDDEIEDGFFEVSPRFSLTESQQEFNYNVYYRPTFTTFAKSSNIDGIDHLASGDGRWSVTPIDSLSFGFLYSDYRRLRADQVQNDVGVFFLEPSDRNRLRRANGRISYSRQITPDWSGFVSVNVDDFDPVPDNRGSAADTRAYSGRIGGNHAFNQKTSAGLSAGGRFRDTRVQRVDDNTGIDPPNPVDPTAPSSNTLIWDFSVNLSHQLSETMSISAQVGPSFISTELVPDIFYREIESRRYRQETSIFAAVSFTKRWKRSRFSANYVRSEFRGGFSASSTISDEVDFDLVHEWTRRLVSRIKVGWNQRQQIVDVPGAVDTDTTQWRAILTNTYKINRKLSLIGQYVFRRQDREGGVNSSFAVDTHTGFLSLRYTFDPITF